MLVTVYNELYINRDTRFHLSADYKGTKTNCRLSNILVWQRSYTLWVVLEDPSFISSPSFC
jgi:hypothetical protein